MNRTECVHAEDDVQSTYPKNFKKHTKRLERGKMSFLYHLKKVVKLLPRLTKKLALPCAKVNESRIKQFARSMLSL